MEKCGKEGKNICSHIFFILLKINTNYAHVQNFIQIPQKMKTVCIQMGQLYPPLLRRTLDLRCDFKKSNLHFHFTFHSSNRVTKT